MRKSAETQGLVAGAQIGRALLTTLQVSVSRNIWRRIGLLLAAAGTAVVFFLVGVVFRVFMGPVSLGPLNAELRSALRQQLPGLQLRFDEAALQWSRDEGRINLVIFGTRVLDRNDRIIAQAPEAEIGLAAGPFVLGKIVIRRIALVGVQLTLVHTRTGTLRLGVEHDRSQSDILRVIRDAIARSASEGGPSLKSFAVHRARLAFFDEATGAFVVAPEAELQISDGQSGRPISSLTAAIDAQLEISGKPAHLLASVTLPHKGSTLTGDFSITNLSLRALASNSRNFAFLEPFALIADASGSFTVVHGNTLRYADVGIGASGIINGLGVPLHVKALRLVGRYDGTTGRVLIDDANVESDHFRGHLVGVSNLAYDAGGSLSAASFSLAVDKLGARMPGIFPQSVSLVRALLRGSYALGSRQFTIDQAIVSGGPFSASLAGKIILETDRSPAVNLDGRLNAIAIRDLLRYWPYDAAPGVRDWIQANISAGRIGPVMIHTNIPAGVLDQTVLPESALAISFPVNAATITYIHGLVPLTGVAGVAQLSGDMFKADVTSAAAGPLSVTRGHVFIPNLHLHDIVSDMSVHVEGPLPDVLALADMKPLQYPSRFHVNPAATKGAAALDLDFHVPMLRNLSVGNIGISIRAAVSGMSLALGPHTKITNGSANFKIDNSSLNATGELGFGTTTLAVDWQEVFKPLPITTHVYARGTLDDAARAAFNLNTEHILKGPVGVVAELEGKRGAIETARIDADLSPATLAVDLVNIKKAAGAPASASISARLDHGGNFRSADIVLSGGTLSAKGSAAFSDSGQLERLELASVRDGGLNDFALSMSDTPATGLNLVISGHSADGTALARRSSHTGNTAGQNAPESSEPFHVSARLDRLVMREGMNLAPFALDVSGIGQRPRTLALSAMLSKSAQVTASITSSDSARRLTLASNDAGLLLKGLFGFTSFRSGQLNVTATMPPMSAGSRKEGAEITGQAVIRDCTVVNQAFLTRLFSSGSLTGFVDLMRGQGIALDSLQVPFHINGDVIDIHDARASGPSIGITTDGYVDRANDQIALQGAIAPLYGINGVLGAIPLLGDVLVSKKGEGIFGMTYRATGDANQPQVAVNPLAMLAPGIFRRIFEGSAPSSPPPQASSAPPVKPQ